MNPSVAPFNPTQLSGMQQILGANPAYSQAIGSGITAAERLMSGANFGSVPQVSAGSASASSAGFTPANVNIPGLVGNVGAGMATMPLAQQNFDQAKQAQGAMNPYLNEYYNSAADQMTKLYKYSTAPSEMSAAAQAGAFGGSADAAQRMMGNFGLGQNLASLGAQIYEPAWAQQQQIGEQYAALGTQSQLTEEQMAQTKGLDEAQMAVQQALSNSQTGAQVGIANAQMGTQASLANAQMQLQAGMANQSAGLMGQQLQAQTQLGALGMLPGLASSLYTPGNMSLGVGGMQQQQGQNILNSITQGANQMQQYPYNVLGQYGGAVSSLLGPFSGTQLTQPNPNATGSKK
jgi:hypothetical protein